MIGALFSRDSDDGRQRSLWRRVDRFVRGRGGSHLASARGGRRFAVLGLAPVFVPMVLVFVELLGDAGNLGWLGSRSPLGVWLVLLAVGGRFLLRVAGAGLESTSDADFEARTTDARRLEPAWSSLALSS